MQNIQNVLITQLYIRCQIRTPYITHRRGHFSFFKNYGFKREFPIIINLRRFSQRPPHFRVPEGLRIFNNEGPFFFIIFSSQSDNECNIFSIEGKRYLEMSHTRKVPPFSPIKKKN